MVPGPMKRSTSSELPVKLPEDVLFDKPGNPLQGTFALTTGDANFKRTGKIDLPRADYCAAFNKGRQAFTGQKGPVQLAGAAADFSVQWNPHSWPH